jgi:RNA polymerase sigma-32 factor
MTTDSSNQLMPLSLSAPGVNLGAYISTVNQIPILTAEQEKELAERYYYDQDLDAAKLLVMSHYVLSYILHVAMQVTDCHKAILFKKVTLD